MVYKFKVGDLIVHRQYKNRMRYITGIDNLVEGCYSYKNINGSKNMGFSNKDYTEIHYRLATKAERILYGQI